MAALASLGRADAFDKLRVLLASSDGTIRHGAVSAIVQTGGTRLKVFAYQMRLNRQPAFAVMLTHGLLDPKDPRDKAVFEEIMTSGEERSQVIAAEHLLGTVSTSMAEGVIKHALNSQDWSLRLFALDVASRHPQLRSELANRLSDPDPRFQAAALLAIAELHQKGSQTCRQGGSDSVDATHTITANNFTIAKKTVKWTCAGEAIQD